jgi:hypothetical protein
MKTIKFLFVVVFGCLAVTAPAQRYFTKSGSIYFNASGEAEVIEATNKTVTCVMDSKTGALQFAVMMKGFLFEKALMEERFNENYVEGSKFPKAEFKGEITNNSTISYTKDGVYPAKVKGKLTLHGITKEIEAEGTVTIKEGKPQLASEFKILLNDYAVEIPGLVKDKVSNNARIKVDCKLELLKS